MSNSLIYYPEGDGKALDFVGYNHAIGLLMKAAGGLISPRLSNSAVCRLYINIPWHHNPESLKIGILPLVAYTMFESTRLPSAWTNFLNKHCAAVLVPSQFCKDAFQMSGVIRPIKIVPLCIDPEEFSYVEPKKHEGFNFLWCGHHYDPYGRKAAGIVEQAFRELKRDGILPDNCSLFMKYKPHPKFPLEIDWLHIGGGIFHIALRMDKQPIKDMYSITDCCINPSHGEGFGFIPAEQMAMGLPVILTNWSFPFINPEYNIPADYDLAPSAVTWPYKHFEFGRWGFNYNRGRLIKEYLLPRLLNEPATGEMEYGADMKPTKSKWTLGKQIIKWIAKAQLKSGFYFNPQATDKKYTLLFERNGYDAWVKLDDLKKKMADVYHNQEGYRAMGKRASQFIAREYSLAKTNAALERAMTELITEKVLKTI